MAVARSARISLSTSFELIHRHFTRALVDEVWGSVRVTERRRVWCLWELALFWMSVVAHAPRSLRAALAEGTGESPGRFRAPEAVPQAFFARSQNLSWRFFAALFDRFRARLAAAAPRTFAGALRPLLRRFGRVEAVDCSRLDPVRRRLKILWRDRRAVLAGSLLAFYDFATGTVSQLVFTPDAAASEFRAAIGALDRVARGTLLVGDRLYGVQGFFRALSARGIFGVARRSSTVKVSRVGRLSRRLGRDGAVEDWEVIAGSPDGSGPQRLRLIRLLSGGRAALELFTNVLDPRRLGADEALVLYRRRWTIERLFSDLKEVLGLRRFYGANTNSVGMQVFAAAMVHTAMRVAQAMAARQANVEPEAISPKKFFPKAAAASAGLCGSECTFDAVLRANPGLRIRKPGWHRMRYASTTLDEVRVESRRSLVRAPPRPRHTTRPGERTWRSLPRARARSPTTRVK